IPQFCVERLVAGRMVDAVGVVYNVFIATTVQIACQMPLFQYRNNLKKTNIPLCLPECRNDDANEERDPEVVHV
ncbi:hypothetical protein LSAT2_025168, partial [Lamellibrachia satsuma]